MKFLLVSFILFNLKGFSQTDLAFCGAKYESAINNYITNKNSIKFKEELNFSKKEYVACLLKKPFPILNLIDINGKKLKIDSNKRKIFVMQFWSSWCPPCMAEIPMINNLYLQFDSSKVKFVTLSYNKVVQNENKSKFKSHFIENCSEISKELGVLAYPTIYIISLDFKISKVYLGADKNNIKKLYTNLKNDIINELKR